jgi:hypothetical protein
MPVPMPDGTLVAMTRPSGSARSTRPVLLLLSVTALAATLAFHTCPGRPLPGAARTAPLWPIVRYVPCADRILYCPDWKIDIISVIIIIIIIDTTVVVVRTVVTRLVPNKPLCAFLLLFLFFFFPAPKQSGEGHPFPPKKEKEGHGTARTTRRGMSSSRDRAALREMLAQGTMS